MAETTYEFHVYDEDGFWGGMRVTAKDATTAERKCRRFLDENELEPDGSLQEGYTLRLVKPENVATS